MQRLNPGIRSAIATNYEGPLLQHFNHTIHIPEHHFAHGRQWLTRLLYLTKSPFELTLELDSTVTMCSTTLLHDLHAELASARFDFAAQIEVARSGNHGPGADTGRVFSFHNFVLLYRWNSRTRKLLREWFDIYKHVHNTTDDQRTLYRAATSPAVVDAGTRIAKVRDNFAVGFLGASACPLGVKNVRCTRAIRGPISMIHSHDRKRIPQQHHGEICDYINSTGRRRLFRENMATKAQYEVLTAENSCPVDKDGKLCRYLALDDAERASGIVESIPSSTIWANARV
jgi:hypothetical protein